MGPSLSLSFAVFIRHCCKLLILRENILLSICLGAEHVRDIKCLILEGFLGFSFLIDSIYQHIDDLFI